MTLTCSSLQADATVKCWGGNPMGQLGQGDAVSRGSNPNGPSLAHASQLAHPVVPAPRFLILCSCFTVSRHHVSSPVAPPRRAELGTILPSVDLGAGRRIAAVSAGGYHTCALLVSTHSFSGLF